MRNCRANYWLRFSDGNGTAELHRVASIGDALPVHRTLSYGSRNISLQRLEFQLYRSHDDSLRPGADVYRWEFKGHEAVPLSSFLLFHFQLDASEAATVSRVLPGDAPAADYEHLLAIEEDLSDLAMLVRIVDLILLSGARLTTRDQDALISYVNAARHALAHRDNDAAVDIATEIKALLLRFTVVNDRPMNNLLEPPATLEPRHAQFL